MKKLLVLALLGLRSLHAFVQGPLPVVVLAGRDKPPECDTGGRAPPKCSNSE